MLKTTAKIFLLFILLATVAIVTGFVTFTLTKRIAEEKAVETVEAATTEANVPVPATTPEKPQISETAADAEVGEYYTVRLEGTTVGVYISRDGKEEFLYHANVYKNDLSTDDLNLLREGVRLNGLSELTGFIENFTS